MGDNRGLLDSFLGPAMISRFGEFGYWLVVIMYFAVTL